MIMIVMGNKNAAMFKWENTDFNWDVGFQDMVIIKNDIIVSLLSLLWFKSTYIVSKNIHIFRKYMKLRKISEFFISIYIFKKSRYLFTYYRLDFILALLLIEIIWGWNLDNRKGFGSNLVGFPVAILAKNSPVTGPSLKPEPK